MWHGTSVYNGYLRGLVLLTPFAECLLGNCHNLLNNWGLLQLGFEPPTFCMRGKCSYRLQQWFRLLNTNLHFKYITMKHKQCSTHINMLFVFSLSRSPVPPCQFPGSDIYTNMIAFLYLSTNYEEFVNDERFAIFISTLNCKLHTFSCYFLCQNLFQKHSANLIKFCTKNPGVKEFQFFFLQMIISLSQGRYPCSMNMCLWIENYLQNSQLTSTYLACSVLWWAYDRGSCKWKIIMK